MAQSQRGLSGHAAWPIGVFRRRPGVRRRRRHRELGGDIKLCSCPRDQDRIGLLMVLTEIHSFDYASEAEVFDYGLEAELFPARARSFGRQPLGYKQFARAADAICFAIEELPPHCLVGSYLQVNDE